MRELNIIPCRPAKLDGLPKIPDLDLLGVVTVEHTLTQCDQCKRDCWIGPKGAEMRRRVTDALVLCYVCCADEIAAGNRPDVIYVMMNGKPAPLRGV